MTLCVCPNLAIDRVIRLDAMTCGTALRATSMQHQAGGKGANVARAVRALGGDSLLVGFGAGHTGRLIGDLAGDEDLDALLVVTSGEARVSTVILELDGRCTALFEHGPRIGADDEVALLEAVRDQHAANGEWAIVNGSAPPGASEGFFADLILQLRDNGFQVMLDAAGTQLQHGLAARPEIVKINAAEAGAKAEDRAGAAAALQACERLIAAGAQTAVVTMAAAGAAGIAAGTHYRVTTRAVEPVNPTGSGDCFAAGLLCCLERGDDFAAALAVAAGVGAANAASPLTAHFDIALAADLARAAAVEPT